MNLSNSLISRPCFFTVILLPSPHVPLPSLPVEGEVRGDVPSETALRKDFNVIAGGVGAGFGVFYQGRKVLQLDVCDRYYIEEWCFSSDCSLFAVVYNCEDGDQREDLSLSVYDLRPLWSSRLAWKIFIAIVGLRHQTAQFHIGMPGLPEEACADGTAAYATFLTLFLCPELVSHIEYFL